MQSYLIPRSFLLLLFFGAQMQNNITMPQNENTKRVFLESVCKNNNQSAKCIKETNILIWQIIPKRASTSTQQQQTETVALRVTKGFR